MKKKYKYYLLNKCLLGNLLLLFLMVDCFGSDTDNIIMPHMEREIIPGKNYIYCPSFQMVWDDVHHNILKQPPRFQNPCKMADILNKNKYNKENLYPERYYIKSGFIKDKIVDLIIREFTKKFGIHQRIIDILRENDTMVSPLDFISFAYLQAKPKFQHPFYVFKTPLIFKSKSKSSNVESFGISDVAGSDGQGLFSEGRSQIKVGYYKNKDEFIIKIFAISEVLSAKFKKSKIKVNKDKEIDLLDLDDCISPDDELIFAKVKPMKTLKETWLKVLERLGRGVQGMKRILRDGEIVKIPKLRFDEEVEYTALYNNNLKNKGFKSLQIKKALQCIKFKLNEKGADLESFVVTEFYGCSQYVPPPRSFILDKPFLLALRQKNKAPYLVLWIANPAILTLWKNGLENRVDYYKMGVLDAERDFSNGVLKRKVSGLSDKHSKLRAEIYKKYFNIPTEIKSDIKGEILSNYLRGYNNSMFDRINEKNNQNIKSKAEQIVKILIGPQGAAQGDLLSLKDRQNSDGGWGDKESSVLLSSMALLAFMAHGETLFSPVFGKCLESACKKLLDLNKSYKATALTNIYQDDVILALALSEFYTTNKIPEIKRDVLVAAKRAFTRKHKNSIWYLLLLRSLSFNDAVPESTLDFERTVVRRSLQNRIDPSENPDLKDCVIALFGDMTLNKKMPEKKNVAFIVNNSPFKWDETTNKDDLERYFAQTLLFLNLMVNKQKKPFSNWNSPMRKGLFRIRSIDPKEKEIVYPVNVPATSFLSKKDYQLYANLMAFFLHTTYFRYLPSVRTVKIK